MTTYKLLKDYHLVDGVTIIVIPKGAIITNKDSIKGDYYVTELWSFKIPKLVVENNPDFFEEVKKPREWYIALDKEGNLLGISIKDNAFYGTTNLIKVREVIE